MKSYIIYIIATILVVSATYYVGYRHGKSIVTVKYLEKEKLVHDTTIVTNTLFKRLPARIDTVATTDILTDDKPLVVAHSDTVYTKDSSTIKVDYYFPPINKFDIMANIKNKIIYRVETREIEKPETFWDRFGSSIQIGIGYGWLKKNVDIYSGIGFHFRIN